MSIELTPYLWIRDSDKAQFDSAKGDLGLTIPVWNNSLNEFAKSNAIKPMDVPLYTLEQVKELAAQLALATHHTQYPQWRKRNDQ